MILAPKPEGTTCQCLYWLRDILDRMPVILRQQDEALWLDREHFDAELLQSLLVPYDHAQMRACPVPSIVGSPKNDLPECIQEISDPPLFL
ncbi:SOS response-associated peptidase family protein [Brevibacillus parabrevis]|uniref:SOS response-associated peptidase family protein n=1 Tax=Brevibacillus parabrevis TaxID=54914 RepID=UPI0022B62888|nr:SOS response-associated peptidase family protein [Brevibacillus parabrevis]